MGIQNKEYIYELEFKVRDYECDLQGIVNNANYQHYTEHTRHEFLLAHGVSFAALHDQGIDCVVARINMQFKVPLRSGEEFDSCLWLKKDGIKFVFMQDIFRASDHKLVLRAQVDTVCIVNGRLSDCQQLNETFAEFL
jgi:acyl-CoA thioester hydrolase